MDPGKNRATTTVTIVDERPNVDRIFVARPDQRIPAEAPKVAEDPTLKFKTACKDPCKVVLAGASMSTLARSMHRLLEAFGPAATAGGIGFPRGVIVQVLDGTATPTKVVVGVDLPGAHVSRLRPGPTGVLDDRRRVHRCRG